MKSKEDILKEFGCYETLGDYLLINHILELMDEHAKQMAIGFSEWLSEHPLDFQPTTPDGSWIGVNMKTYSSSELFEEYIKTIKE